MTASPYRSDLREAGEQGAIIAAWDSFIAANQKNARAWLERGETYYQMGEMQGALSNALDFCRLCDNEACARSADGWKWVKTMGEAGGKKMGGLFCECLCACSCREGL